MVDIATEHKFRRIFKNDPNIGGRYSALSFFGMVPAAFAGYDVNLLLDRGLGAMHANDKIVDPHMAPGVRFGAAIGRLAINGRDKLTIVTHPDVAAFGAWAEQLIAESTGKHGNGIVPIEGEELGTPEDYGNDRVFVYVGANLPDPAPGVEEKLAALEAAGHPVIRLAMNDQYDLGEQFYLWEIATAAAGSILGINAFDQPNVQESKDNTKALLEQYAANGPHSTSRTQTSKARSFDITFLSGSSSIQAKDTAQRSGVALRTSQAGTTTSRFARTSRATPNTSRCCDDLRLTHSQRGRRRYDRRFWPALPALDRTAS